MKINGTIYKSNVTVDVGKGAVEMRCQEIEEFSLVKYTSTDCPSTRERIWQIADGAQGTVRLDIYY